MQNAILKRRFAGCRVLGRPFAGCPVLDGA